MKILFISSGNSKYGISPIIKNQGDSLSSQGMSIDFFTIKGKGLNGYFKNISRLKKYMKKNNYDIVHAHYSLSAFVASLALAKPLVVSLMGSDVKSSGIYRYIIKFFQYFFWDETIVKSIDMKESLNFGDVKVIPNGVDFKRFKPIDKLDALNETNWEPTKKHILFTSNPNRVEKNYSLCKDAFDLLKLDEVELQMLDNISNDKVPFYINSSDVILLTSLWEGSPNVVKEAMACNIPIVSTNVGDVRDVTGNTEGCFVTSFEPEDVADKIQKALSFNKKTTGREDINQLESSIIANKIIKIYESVLKNKLIKSP